MLDIFIVISVGGFWLFHLVSWYQGWKRARKYKGPGKGVEVRDASRPYASGN